MGQELRCEVYRKASSFVKDTELSGAADAVQGWDVTQRDLGRLETWPRVNILRFNQAKCKVMHTDQGNPQQQHRLRLGRRKAALRRRT